MRTTLVTLCCVALIAAEPTAHDPQFNRAELWPTDVAATAYARQTWPPAPLYVWSPADGSTAETDPKEPANWTVDGKPAATPPGPDCDVLFAKPVRLKRDTRLYVRHVTIEKGASVQSALQLRPLGNVWIKPGASFYQLVIEFLGDKDVFLRNEVRDWRSKPALFANKIIFNKKPGSAIEVLGTFKVGDEMVFMNGTTIVGPDTQLLPGNRSSQPIYPGATLALMSGSSFFKRGNQPYATDLVVSGSLLAGTPERPLTRDCTLALSFKTKGPNVIPGTKPGSPSDYGMVVNPKGRLAVHSADPAKARLVITWNGLSSPLHQGEDVPDPVARHVDLVLQGEVSLAGVVFDRIRRGGIHLADPAIRERGVIAFGEHNEAAPDELFARLEKPIEAKLIISVAGGQLTKEIPQGASAK